MINSTLEITENEYLIKLNRNNFNLSFIRSLLKMVEVANPAEAMETLTSDRYYTGKPSSSSEPEYYSSIEEK